MLNFKSNQKLHWYLSNAFFPINVLSTLFFVNIHTNIINVYKYTYLYIYRNLQLNYK